MSNKVYCGKAKCVQGQYGEFFNISLSGSDIDKIVEAQNEAGWANLKMTPLRTPDARGNTHAIYFYSQSTINGTFDFEKGHQYPPLPVAVGFGEDEIPF